MRVVVAIAILTATVASSQPTFPPRLSCVQIGVWACHPEPEGICIDGHRKRGSHYSFNAGRMTFKGPEGRGRILSISRSDRGTSMVRLSNATEFQFDPDHTTRWGHIVLTLTPVPLSNAPYSAPELWCRTH